MQTIRYIKEHGLKNLQENFSVNINYYLDRIVLNYDQIKSPLYHPIVKECRGLILSYPSLKVLCRSFDRFYNRLQDPNYTEFFIEKSICMEKIDGTLCNVYHDGESWKVATRKTAFAEGTIQNGSISYKTYFEDILGKSVNQLFSKLCMSKNYTYIFEAAGPRNRIISNYQEDSIYLLSIRDNTTGKEITGHDISNNNVISTTDFYQNVAKILGVKYPKLYRIDSLKALENTLENMDPLAEGFVLYSPEKQWRIKIKNATYLAAHRIRSFLCPKSISKLVCSDMYSEYLDNFPEDEFLFLPYVRKFNEITDIVLKKWQEVKDIKNRKLFAESVKSFPYKHILFHMRNGGSVRSFFEKISDRKRLEFFKYINE